MKALVKFDSGPGSVALREVPAPALRDGSVLIKVSAVAVCGTDRLALTGGQDSNTPRILGHEVSGIVESIAPDVNRDDLDPGVAVTVETDAVLCGVCEYCRLEQANRCPDRRGIGTTTDGGLAEYLVMPERAVHRLPPGLDLITGALTEPTAVAVHAAIEQSPPLAGRTVVVIGPGAIGLLTAHVAAAVGAQVILVGRSRHLSRLNLATEKLGVSHIIDSQATNPTEEILRLTHGYGAHTVFECSGSSDELTRAPTLLRRGGRVVMVAFYKEAPGWDINDLMNREIEIVGSRGKRPSSYRTALAMMHGGQLQPEHVVDRVLPLDRWVEGLEAVSHGEKVVLEVAPSSANKNTQ